MSYWEKRQEEAYKAGEMQVNQYFMRLEKAFNQAKRELQKTVESFYWRYAKENGLTYSEAQKRLDKAELGELKDFVEKAMNNIGKYNQDVNNMSIKARMTRYQTLEAQVDAILRELYAVEYEAKGHGRCRRYTAIPITGPGIASISTMAFMPSSPRLSQGRLSS